ncbi:hypothetical protein CAPTEDRAFT_164867 [Capitella teleta]|uniref:Dynamin N-terminal domain-containing protein n=1 Tax=Capitella teleta TaxID=283909 RepID=R7VFQ6_CAPTE|nr:hypothetical protein CAPTEDRAFT_164867 [Capitella teleta]|eukprot:ELU15126.1 hypothetical protein CAPTEDRAFT_164867 [Capitella teleta]
MSGKVRSRTAADSATLSVNERILKECHTLYTDPENGLIKIAEDVKLSLLAPRKKITVLLIGNHSAGKSSFINWYVEEHVQRTGVAIETQGFTFVTSGTKRESLTGNATLHLYPHFEPLRQIEGVCDFLTTEISTSKQKKFSLVTFVDTPGLVDGDMKYPFDVNEAITWLGDLADLVFVFFDPIGQALCKRTLSIVEQLNDKHADRMRFFLSKADEAGPEGDRQRVLMQIVQELCKRPGLNRTCFDMPTIYIPNPSGKVANRCVNQIDEVCKEVEKTIKHTIQNTLNSLEKDCENIATLIDDKLENDRVTVSNNFRSGAKGSLFCCMGLLLPVLLAVTYLAALKGFQEAVIASVGKATAESVFVYLNPLRNIRAAIPQEYQLHLLGMLVALTLFLLLLAKLSARRKPTLNRRQKRALNENRDYVRNYVKNKKEALYKDYLKQSVGDHDL